VRFLVSYLFLLRVFPLSCLFILFFSFIPSQCVLEVRFERHPGLQRSRDTPSPCTPHTTGHAQDSNRQQLMLPTTLMLLLLYARGPAPALLFTALFSQQELALIRCARAIMLMCPARSGGGRRTERRRASAHQQREEAQSARTAKERNDEGVQQITVGSRRMQICGLPGVLLSSSVVVSPKQLSLGCSAAAWKPC
jgi:hypothetical protein